MERTILGVCLWVVFIFGLLAMLVCLVEYLGGGAMSGYEVAGAEGTLALFLTSVVAFFRGKVK